MSKTDKLAKIIRVVTTPPLLALALVLTVYFTRREVFRGAADLALALVCLTALPLAAYPAQRFMPGYKDKGREGQRNLAMLFNAVGFSALAIYAYSSRAPRDYVLIANTYLLSVALLLVFNKLLKVKASGHFCAVFGPMLLSVYLVSLYAIIPCLAIGALIVWASVRLGRHTPAQLLFGGLSSGVAFAVSALLSLIW